MRRRVKLVVAVIWIYSHKTHFPEFLEGNICIFILEISKKKFEVFLLLYTV